MIAVEPQQQLEFLSNIQRLLSEGQFTATYKYALLLAIADICVREGEDDGAPFVIQTNKIAEKFIAYYWLQVRPYEGVVLRQNTGKAPAIISAMRQVAGGRAVALHQLKRDAGTWQRLVRKVDYVVRKIPLWKLQIVGNAPLEFLYENRGHGTAIELKPGVMFCLRRFHELVTESESSRVSFISWDTRRKSDDMIRGNTRMSRSEANFGREACRPFFSKQAEIDSFRRPSPKGTAMSLN